MNLYQNIPSLPGEYLLILKVHKEMMIRTHGKRKFSLDPGIYVYIGSAHGLGGLRSRIIRHMRKNKKIFWHIDYLTTSNYVKIIGLVTIISFNKNVDFESMISKHMLSRFKPILGFGCSDKKRDKSHLYYCGKNLSECLKIIKEILSLIKPLARNVQTILLTPTRI
ncbi:MAG: GIY-YIG nuclease family protein [Staphylothermus sp.]|nr:GIY-YIG nuclease family protein [Staphylothermus sp.]